VQPGGVRGEKGENSCAVFGPSFSNLQPATSHSKESYNIIKPVSMSDSDSDEDFGPQRPSAAPAEALTPTAPLTHTAHSLASKAINESSDDEETGPAKPIINDETPEHTNGTPAPPPSTTLREHQATHPAKKRPLTHTDKLRSQQQKQKQQRHEAALKQHNHHITTQLTRLPSAHLYERSYLHLTPITYLTITPHTDFLITCSSDGILKLWKRTFEGIEFIKQYRSHSLPEKSNSTTTSAIHHLAVSSDGQLCSTVGIDQSCKIYDVLTFDMIGMLRLDYIPLTSCWIHPPNRSTSGTALLAISSISDEKIRIYGSQQQTNNDEPLYTIHTLHTSPVTIMTYSPIHNLCISVDRSGCIQYWSPNGLKQLDSDSTVDDSILSELPSTLTWKHKIDTDLYTYQTTKNNTILSLQISQDGQYFVTTGRDRMVRVWLVGSGKVVKTIDESLQRYEKLQTAATSEEKTLKLDAIEFGRRLSVEREIDRLHQQAALSSTPIPLSTPLSPVSTAIFDDSSTFILHTTMYGIKVYDIRTATLQRIIGNHESHDRFLQLSLYQSIPRGGSKSTNTSIDATIGSGASLQTTNAILAGTTSITSQLKEDPVVFCSAYKRERFCWFSQREPTTTESDGTGRDIYNERPTATNGDAMVRKSVSSSNLTTNKAAQLGRMAAIHTTMGDITVVLHVDDTPKTSENFLTLAQQGYFNGLLFHRVIKQFMIQTGDPKGDGTGGKNIWNLQPGFADEFNIHLKHDKPGILSMANSGPSTNNSQFFITTIPCPWLDNKHTVFGYVIRGMDVVHAIEKVRVDKQSKPVEEVKIVSVNIVK